MPEPRDKDDMEHRETEVFELSPMLEGDERDSDEGREDEALLPVEEHAVQHDAIPEPTPPSQPIASPAAFAKVEFLDGVRGMAAVWVLVQHIMGGFTYFSGHERGFGADGVNYHFITLPVARLFFGNGGNAAVVIFFVLSGYVLSISSFRKLKQDKPAECRRALLSALIRRPLRLYIPPLVISFIDAMLLHVPGPLVMPLPWDGGKPKEGGIWNEIKFFVDRSVDYFSIFREHGSNFFAYPYNSAMWTIPIELKGSLLVFGVVFVLSLGMHGPDYKVPLMVALMLFCAAAIMLQRFWKWSMVCFLFGMVLALVDTWPIGETINSALTPPDKVGEFCSKITPKWAKTTPWWVVSLRERWTAVRSVKLTPEWISKRLSKRADRPRPTDNSLESHRKPTFFAHICLWVGLYLLSEPAHAGDRTFTTHTPGWVWLSSLIPEQYDDERYYRYWQSWASILFIYAVLRIPYLQSFFCTRLLRFLGYVSFMLYLTHLPFFRIFPDRMTALFGGSVDEVVKGTFWDQTWAIPEWGLYGIHLRFWVSMAVVLPSSLLVAWVFTKCLDTPSVKLGKWITRMIGLDRKKPSKPAAEEPVLPMREMEVVETRS